MRWRNWEGRYTCHPESILFPESLDELMNIIRKANKDRKEVKVVGAGHSWSDIACSDQLMISLDRLCRVIDVQKERCQITVQAGIRLYVLNYILREHDLAMRNLGSVCEQSIGGAIATGTHGTGLQFGSLSTQILALELITAEGEILTASKDQNPDLFNAARVHLGALGVIISVTLQCEPAFLLHAKEAPVRFGDILQSLPQRIQENQHVKLWWFPHTDFVQAWDYNRTQRPRAMPHPFVRWFNDVFLGQYVSWLLLFLFSFFPRITPWLNRFLRWSHFKEKEKVGAGPEIFSLTVKIKHPEMEYAIPVEHATEALRDIKELIETHGFKVNFIVEVRFVQGDNIWMSPAFERDSCYIGVMMYNQPHEAYFRACEDIFRRYQGRPHWGKLFYLNREELAACYPHWDDFFELRERLDPDQIFCNPYLKRLLPPENIDVPG